MRRRSVLVGIASLAVLRCASAQSRLPRIALLPGTPLSISAFSEELARLGWADGRTAYIERRDAEGDEARVSVIARETISSKPDVIVAGHTPMLVALKALTTTIPVVAISSADPISLGLTGSLSHPTGNFTGFAAYTDDLTGKRLELLQQLRPDGRAVALLLNPRNPLFPRIFDLATTAAKELGWEVRVAGYESAPEVLPAIDRAKAEGADAILVLPDPLAQGQASAIVIRATNLRLPFLFFYRESLLQGALLVYGVDQGEQWRQVAGYVDRLLRGANVGDLPFVQPSRLYLGVNLKTARAMNLTVPADILIRADEVIE